MSKIEHSCDLQGFDSGDICEACTKITIEFVFYPFGHHVANIPTIQADEWCECCGEDRPCSTQQDKEFLTAEIERLGYVPEWALKEREDVK